MPAVTTPSTSPRPSTTHPKMEDRKRPAVNSTDELAPPSKRVAVNGSKPKDDALEMKEESWVEVRAAQPPFFFDTGTRRAQHMVATSLARLQIPYRDKARWVVRALDSHHAVMIAVGCRLS